MIQISQQHKDEIKTLLTNYTPTKLSSVLPKISPILQFYYTADPQKLGARLLNRLFQAWLNKPNEAIVHYWAISKVIYEYQYSAEQIDLEVDCGGIGRKALDHQPALTSTFADIVVYSHASRRPGTALIVVECREWHGVVGNKQAASYARALQAKYHLFTDSEAWNAFETQPHPIDGLPVSDIPLWVGFKPLVKRLSKQNLLPPLTDETQLRDLVKICHDNIHKEGLDPGTAFDELVKLLFVKVYDEQEIPQNYEFSVLAGESADQTGSHIRELLKQASQKSRYKELFAEPGDNEFSISNAAIRKVVETFQGFSFTGNSIIGIDAKGTVYENMVGSTFRGELGQYFTPRKIVEFMVDLLKPTRDDLVLDPSCGSGGFLIYVLRQVAGKIRTEQQNLPQHQTELLIKQYVDDNIFGADLSPRMVRAARMNMIMHGDGWSGIQREHGLRLHQGRHTRDKFTLILSNPPFAGFETEEAVLDEFEVGHNAAGNVRGVNRALIFVEQIIHLLQEGGRAGMVLPRSVFENESYSFRKLRSLLFEKCEITALIGLPRTAFWHTDCAILGDLLFIKKVAKPRPQYNVFVGWAENVGYNTLGHNLEENDFPALLDAYANPDSQNEISINTLKQADNINPWHYHPTAKDKRLAVQARKQDFVPLTALVYVYKKRIARSILRQTPDRVLRYAQVDDFDPITGAFKTSTQKITTLPSRATYELDGQELILLPNARNSLESKRKVIKVGQETKGMILTNRFLPLVPKVNADFLVMSLNTDFVREQLIAECKGAGSPDIRESKLANILIPVPDSNDLSSIDSFMEGIADKIARRQQLEMEVFDLEKAINSTLENLAKQTN